MRETVQYKAYARTTKGDLEQVALKTNIDIHHHLYNHAAAFRQQCEQNDLVYPVLAVVNGGKQ